MLGQMMTRPLLISSLIDWAERWYPRVEIVSRLTDGSVHRSDWGAVAARAKQLANALLKLGVKPGDRVATIAWNTHRHLELYFAVSGIGAVLHTINPRLSPDQLFYVVDHAEDSLLFFDSTFTKLADFLRSQPTQIRHWCELGDAYERLIADEPASFAWPELDENAASSMCYTSGTVGHPKGVLYSHRSTVLHSYGIAMADALGISARDSILTVVPMFHVNAWGVPYAAAMVGAKLVLPGPGLDGKNLTELIRAERVNCLLGVPTVWMGLLAHLRAEGLRVEGLTKVVVGGAACPPSMIQAFEQEHGATVIHAWGMTETSPVGTVCVLLPKHDHASAEERLAVQSRQGRPVFGVDLRLVDDDGAPVPHDGAASGHLQVRGSWVAAGYFKRDSDGQHTPDGWFNTGDIATIDPDGYLQITDRSKDVIKSGGEWISSVNLENAAMGHPSVAMAAAIGVPHAKWQERPMLVVVRAPGQAVTEAALAEYLADRLPRWWLPDLITFVDALPIGATGKVLKRELRARFADIRLE